MWSVLLLLLRLHHGPRPLLLHRGLLLLLLGPARQLLWSTHRSHRAPRGSRLALWWGARWPAAWRRAAGGPRGPTHTTTTSRTHARSTRLLEEGHQLA